MIISSDNVVLLTGWDDEPDFLEFAPWCIVKCLWNTVVSVLQTQYNKTGVNIIKMCYVCCCRTGTHIFQSCLSSLISTSQREVVYTSCNFVFAHIPPRVMYLMQHCIFNTSKHCVWKPVPIHLEQQRFVIVCCRGRLIICTLKNGCWSEHETAGPNELRPSPQVDCLAEADLTSRTRTVMRRHV